jgi:phosphohistidine phosphatase
VTRRLWLLRHAKSDWADTSQSDHERPLNRRGVRSCELLRDHLRDLADEPAVVLCSTAVRTRETLGRLLPAWSGMQTVHMLPALYGADPSEIMYLLHGMADDVPSLLVVGHNPSVGDLALHLASGDDGEDARRVAVKYPTGALATYDVAVPWVSLRRGDAKLSGYVVPADLA